MRFVDLIQLSLHNLLLHKIRSFLTSLGIIFGVASVISMLAISKGAEKEALDQIKLMGIDNILFYTQKPTAEGRAETDSSKQSIIETYGLTEYNLQKIYEMDNILKIDILRNSRMKILKGVKRLDLKMVSVSQTFAKTMNLKISQGRWFSSQDHDSLKMVCVLGKNAYKKLLGINEEPPIGKMIKVEDYTFKIIGIIESSSETNLPQLGALNDMIFISHTLSQKLLGNISIETAGHRRSNAEKVEYDLFVIKIKSLDAINNTEHRITNYLEKSHKEVKDWGKIVPIDLLRQQAKTQNIFTIIMASIASISLLVGGVGIMNIMLANIYERRKEIGTSRALGAKRRDILRQFLVETIFLTTLGGLIGVGLGVIISQIITYYAKWPTVYSMWSILISLFISSIVGIVFGTYPAIKAAEQNPIDTLRAE